MLDDLSAVSAALLAEVAAMGFPPVRVRKAIKAGCADADAVVTWVLEHGEDPGIDDGEDSKNGDRGAPAAAVADPVSARGVPFGATARTSVLVARGSASGHSVDEFEGVHEQRR